jgi:hypothetical protein
VRQKLQTEQEQTEQEQTEQEQEGGQSMNRAQRTLRTALIAVSACLAAAAVAAPSASAVFEFDEVAVSTRDSAGNTSRQAGGHADFTFRFTLPTVEEERDGVLLPFPRESARDVSLDLPPGFFANPTLFPVCTPSQLIGAGQAINQQCPVESQIGVADVVGGVVGIFNLAHGPEVPARFGFNYLGYAAVITPQVRPGDYGLTSGSVKISQAKGLTGATLTFWAYPASPSHDLERQGVSNSQVSGIPYPSAAPNLPFFTNPTACSDEASTFTARGDSWAFPGIFQERTVSADEDGTPFNWEGCENLPFHPSASVEAGTQQAHSPSGLRFRLDVPQSEGTDGLAASTVERVALTLPAGMAISPSTAAGQNGCSLTQVGLGDNNAPACPPNSRIGTVVLETPLLDETLEGNMVLASQGDNPFHATYAVYILINGPGFWLKLPGELQVDRQTGQIRTVFEELPKLPFDAVDVELSSGPLAPLSSPPGCGTYSARSEITPWARPTEPVVQTIPMTFDENCQGGGWSPGLKGGTANATAGKRSPFSVQITRQDGEQNLSRIDITLPEGQLASLKGVAECPDAVAPSGACPASSQIGVTKAAIGVGTSPLQVPQPGKAPTALFLGGPYKGAPLSVIALVPAQAGPFDLGDVVVRTALQVDPLTAQVTAQSEPLPQIIEGVPLQYRSVAIELTRPDFGVNPTSCEPKRITSALTSAGGAVAHPSVPYQVGSCASLEFAPKLELSLKGGTKRSGNPALTAVLTQPKGDNANIARSQVILPKTMFIDNAHINGPCTRVQFNADACPPKSILGTAVAYSPLLDKPLEGPVYFRSNGGERELPDLVADLNGQIHVTLVGFIDSVKVGKESSRVRTRFQNVPDAPVSRFVLKLKGGKKGLLENSVDLCKTKPKATLRLAGQNGKATEVDQLIQTGCKGGKKTKGKD